MVKGIAILLFAQLAGEALHQLTGLPVPGPVIGMFLLAAGMILRGRLQPAAEPAAVTSLERVADALIGSMGLLFVPAGIGIVAIAPMLHGAWLALGIALVGSTILTLIVTGLVMHHIVQRREARGASGTGVAP